MTFAVLNKWSKRVLGLLAPQRANNLVGPYGP